MLVSFKYIYAYTIWPRLGSPVMRTTRTYTPMRKNMHVYIYRLLYAVVCELRDFCTRLLFSHLMSVFTKKYYENFAFFRCCVWFFFFVLYARLLSHKCIDISRNNGFSSFFLASLLPLCSSSSQCSLYVHISPCVCVFFLLLLLASLALYSLLFLL